MKGEIVSMNLKVGSWNIFVYGDREFSKMAELVEEENIEILGIQEAARYFDEEEELNSAKEIAEELDYNWQQFDSVDFRPEKPFTQGNAILSKYPIEKAEKHNLNPEWVDYDGTYETEPRILIEAVIDVGGEKIRFLTTHLQYSNRFESNDIKDAEIEKLIEIVENSDLPTILSGDFNLHSSTEEIQRIAEKINRVEDDSPTWTTEPFEHQGWTVKDLEYRLDNIFYSDDFSEMNHETIYSELSDHLPISATLKISS